MKLILFCALILTALSQPLWANWSERKISPELNVLLFVPPINDSVDSSFEQRALIVHLHGCAQSTKTLKQHANWEQVAVDKDIVIALPQVPRGGVYAGCWDYYGKNHQRDNRHNQHIIEMVTQLLQDEQLKINKKKVFITGLSSGAGQAMVLACLAPDIFRGAGLVATPTVGTEVSEIAKPKTTAEQSLKICLDLAADKQNYLQQQKISVVTAPNDSVVSHEHGKMIKEIYQLLFQTSSSQKFDLSSMPGKNPKGSLEIFRDAKSARLSFIEHEELGHNWPSGQGGRSTGFVYKEGLNYPLYLATYFLAEQRD